MEDCIQHFSHEHPLSFFEVAEDEDSKPFRCSICGLPTLSSPSYTCSIDANCNFFLHKPCAQLPKEFYHPRHLHTLNLEQPKLPAGHSDCVGESCQHFTYKCSNYSDCKFDLHPLLVVPRMIQSKHKSHKPHPLAVFCREIVSLCAVCGEEQKGFFFCCLECNLWIHQDCTILPSILRLPSHPHPYILSYSIPVVRSHSHSTSAGSCSICRGLWRFPKSGVYFCGECFALAHVTCVMSSMENLQTETRPEFIQLPDEEDTFPSVVIRRYLETNPSSQNYHEHPLILEDGIDMSSNSREAASRNNLVCDVCIQPINISSPFYRCQQLQSSNDCHFLAHDICANHLPTVVEFSYAGNLFKAVLWDSDRTMSRLFFNSVFPCFYCRRLTNGFCYYAVDAKGNVFAPFDLECAAVPKIIKHASHRPHLLFHAVWLSNTSIPLSCCSIESFGFDVYRCVVCDFYIHTKCALLPKKTWHKFDEHPLELIMTHRSEDDQQEYCCFCEFCEQDIDRQYWYYGCGKCEQYFHTNCIPSVGYMSKVKFGKTIVDDNIHRNHPLTLTRMLTVGRHERCGVCNQIIKGFVDDEMAFHCSSCDFWIHFSCAWKTSCATGLPINYLQFLEAIEIMVRQLRGSSLAGN